MTITLAIDPGKHHAGYALLVDKSLVRAGVFRVKPPRDTHGPYYRQGRVKQVQAQSAVTIAELIGAHVAVARRIVGVDEPIEIVIELMKIYVDENQKLTERVDPEDLIMTQATAGAIAGEVRAPKRIRYVYASEWKKQRGDEATWGMIRDVMTESEIETAKACGIYDDVGSLGKNFHHGLEAFGIGAWAEYRL